MNSRCAWADGDPMMREYHDVEWGVAEYDSRALWEKLMLDGFQAGLSWSIILRKREAFRKAFKEFDPKKVARFTEKDIARLMQDEGIARARRSWRPSKARRSFWRCRRVAKIFPSGCGVSWAASRSRTRGRCRRNRS